MLKKLLILLIFIPSMVQSQFAIKGNIKPDNNYSWILLYKLKNGQQEYIDNANVVNGEFQFNVEESEPSGIYRAYYQMENNLYVEFIYNKEEIEFTFDPINPIETIIFSKSDENIIYQKYHKKISGQQKIIDSLQVVYFKSEEKQTDKNIIKKYQTALSDLIKIQSEFESLAKGKIAINFIQASAQYYAQTPFKKPQNYIDELKIHFFDALDFKDEVLRNSTFINDRLTDYVFYLNQANNAEARNILEKEAIENVVQRLANDYDLLKIFEETLLQNYLQDENALMLDFVMNQHYNLLPDRYQDAALQYKITASIKTSIGSRATDFSWEENGTKKNLHDLIGYDFYIVVFFSSGCSHCQKEMPEFYDFIQGIENIRVIAIGLEDEKEAWVDMISEFSDFTNILDLDKWSSKKVKDYGITAIPSYFVLDANKVILAKPENINELKDLFEAK